MDLETKIMRMFWKLVEKSDPDSLLKLSDGELTTQLIDEVARVTFLSSDQSEILSQYIGSRTVLIRDLAYSKVE